MKEKIYFDTSIWLDIYEKRNHNGEIAKKLMEKIIKNNCIIIYSNFISLEFKRLGYSKNEINQITSLVESVNKRIVHVTKKQYLEGKKIATKRNLPLGDVIHAIIARDCEAQLVSRDPDFNKLKDITKSSLPETLL